MKKIIYPYNEILPKKAAHDVYIVHSCASFAKTGLQATLLCGSGSLKNDALFKHYGAEQSFDFTIKRLPIIRKNFFPKITWNPFFFYFCQKTIQKNRPDVVICSVLKQADYHLSRKLTNTKYIYEIHELNCYPNGMVNEELFKKEKRIFEKADLLIVTTYALKELVQSAPYNVKTPVEVIPLAVNSSSVSFPEKSSLKVAYVGQLYKGQGVELLLKALSQTSGIEAEIIGGKNEEIKVLQEQSRALGIVNRVRFRGFLPPSELPQVIEQCHACVAPFEKCGRMPYVAHTKLYEYAHWGRPIIAPDLLVVKEHLKKGTLYFKPEDYSSLADTLNSLKNTTFLNQLRSEILSYSGYFSWENRSLIYKKLIN